MLQLSLIPMQFKPPRFKLIKVSISISILISNSAIRISTICFFRLASSSIQVIFQTIVNVTVAANFTGDMVEGFAINLELVVSARVRTYDNELYILDYVLN